MQDGLKEYKVDFQSLALPCITLRQLHALAIYIYIYKKTHRTMGIIIMICHLIFISAFINTHLFPLRVEKNDTSLPLDIITLFPYWRVLSTASYHRPSLGTYLFTLPES